MSISLRTSAVVLTAFAIGSTIPFVVHNSMDAYVLQHDGAILQGGDGTRVPLHRAANAQTKADFERALVIYRDYLQNGVENIGTPDINKRSSIDFYLRRPLGDADRIQEIQAAPLSVKDYVPPAEDVFVTTELSQEERTALTISLKIGRCITDPKFSEDYLKMCRQIIQGKKELNTSGIGSDLMKVKIDSALKAKAVINSRPAFRVKAVRVSNSSSSSASSR